MARVPTLAAIALTLASSLGAQAQTAQPRTLATQPTLNYFGLPGLMDMPTAGAMADGTLGVTAVHFSNQTRATLSFQVLPRLTATFRYAGVEGFNPEPLPGGGNQRLRDGVYFYDRSFDIHWLAIEEGGWWPAVAVGIRDIAGTGVYGSEYVVATRHFGARDQLAVTVGLGWGRLGERDPIGQIAGARPPLDFGEGGTVSFDQFFRGDAALFGGIEWQATDRLRVQIEYSSDLYTREVADDVISIESPWNIGVNYLVSDGVTVNAAYLYGTTVSLGFSFAIDPRRPVTNTYTDAAPEPVRVRPLQDAPFGTDWVAQPNAPSLLRDNLALVLGGNGLRLVSLNADARRAVIRIENPSFEAESMALGRAMRALSVAMPASVEIFEVVFVVDGLDVSRVRLTRSDVEALEHDVNGGALALARAEFEDPRAVQDPTLITAATPTGRFAWGLSPYVRTSLFDPSNPVLFNVGVQAVGRYEFGGGLVADARVRLPVAGNLDGPRSVGTSALPRVRTDGYLYDRESDIYLDYGTLAHYGRPARNLYSRVTVGYLERMYAGISGELLWQPVNSNLGLGLEVNHVWQRAFEDGSLGLQDYDITTGHASAYVDLGGDFEAELHVGRYLAGDWGATINLERTFDNGWRVGAFATFTDVSFEEFGEGSFDKGITLTIPVSWLTGTATRQAEGATVRPIQRDGGARLSVNGRLNDLVRDYTRPTLEETQGLVWR